jgi:UDP-N-acetylmuramoylalanine--D-glutamate ligase
MAQDKKAEVRTFSVSGKKAATVRIEHGRAWAQNGQSISLQTFTLFGRHNLENLIAAVTAALFVHCPVSVIERAMGDFQALPHRLQLVGTCHGVRFVNDSKSTTPASSEKAVEAFSTPVILVAGGRPKGASFQGLAQTSKGRVKYAVFFGEAAEEMTQAFNEIPHQKVETLREAFDSALSKASEGDVLLFSPANASFDQFKNYEDRGEKFVSLVHAYMKAAS